MKTIKAKAKLVIIFFAVFDVLLAVNMCINYSFFYRYIYIYIYQNHNVNV